MQVANRKCSRSTKKEMRAKIRAPILGQKSKQMTTLEEASVSQRCLSHYSKCWDSVKSKLVNKRGLLKPCHQVDALLAKELETLYHDGEDLSSAQYLVASVIFFNSQLKSPSMTKLPRVKQSLKGWRKLAPERSRLPVPWEVCCLLVEHAVYHKLPGFALHMLLMFTMYLRPSEALRVRAADVVKPVCQKRTKYTMWTIVLHPQEVGIPSKTQEFDESLQLDLQYHSGIGEALGRFMHSRRLMKNHVVLQHTNAELITFLEEATITLNLQDIGEIHPYRFRHGGASNDYVLKLRDLQGIQQRGRWKSQASVRRYQKGARLAQIFGKLPNDVQQLAIRAAENLPATLQKVL